MIHVVQLDQAPNCIRMPLVGLAADFLLAVHKISSTQRNDFEKQACSFLGQSLSISTPLRVQREYSREVHAILEASVCGVEQL